jgi:hypothetical protein
MRKLIKQYLREQMSISDDGLEGASYPHMEHIKAVQKTYDYGYRAYEESGVSHEKNPYRNVYRITIRFVDKGLLRYSHDAFGEGFECSTPPEDMSPMAQVFFNYVQENNLSEDESFFEILLNR